VETFVILPQGGSVCHYSPREHALELRCHSPDAITTLFAQLGLPTEITTAIGPTTKSTSSTAPTTSFPYLPFLIGLASLNWREVWKYGERGLRYTQLDIGHAWAALSISASLHGWRLHRLPGMSRYFYHLYWCLYHNFSNICSFLCAGLSDAFIAAALGLASPNDITGVDTRMKSDSVEQVLPAMMALVLPAHFPWYVSMHHRVHRPSYFPFAASLHIDDVI
jgi:hypothetical protein